jgi:aldehyde dehydrogenase (NAD+)
MRSSQQSLELRSGTADPHEVAVLHARQRAALAELPRWNAAQRRERLRGLERALRRHAKALRTALYQDFRKHPDEVDATELNPTLSELRYALRHLARWMRPVPVKTPALLFAARSEIRHEPKGQVLILSPWNYPVFLTLPPLIAALAAGNRAILRPSEKAPATTRALGELIADAFPPEEVALVGGDVDVAEFLLTLPFDHIFFTGSSNVGKRVMRAAAEHLSGVTLELGGKSPAIVDETADVRAAAQRIVWGKFINAGQTCVAPDYVLVHERRLRPLVKQMRRALAREYGRSEADRARSPALCRLIDDAHYARLVKMLDESVTAGARIEAGGGREPAERYLAPTLLTGVNADMPIMQGEIFGPVLPLLTYARLDDALAAVNARPKPLALYVFSRKRRNVAAVLDGTSAGGSVVNDTVVHLANPNLPFGGIGESGVGAYHGEFGFRTFSHQRAILVQRRLNFGTLLYPPYGARTRAVVALVRRFLT